MADNVTLNAGSGGDVVATEDIGGVEYQKVKLVDGTATSTTAIPLSGDLTNGLDVDVTRVSGTVTVDGSGVTQPVSGTVTANLSAADNTVLDAIAASVDSIDTNLGGTHTDDAAFTAGTSDGVPAFAMFDDTTPDSVDEGDAGIVRMSANRNLYTTLRDAAGNERGANVNASGQLNVTGPVTNAGTFAVQVNGAALTALQLIDNPVVAHDAAVSGSTGVNMAGFNARSSEPTAVASADATQGLATLLGKQVVVKGAIPASTWQYASVSGGITDTADDAAKAAAGAGIRNYITGVQVINGHATVSTEVVIKDGSTIIWRGFAQAAGGGCSATFDPPLRGTANTAVNVTNITTGSATYFNLQGYVAAE